MLDICQSFDIGIIISGYTDIDGSQIMCGSPDLIGCLEIKLRHLAKREEPNPRQYNLSFNDVANESKCLKSTLMLSAVRDLLLVIAKGLTGHPDFKLTDVDYRKAEQLLISLQKDNIK